MSPGLDLSGQSAFFTQQRWTPAIALGYGLSIWVHLAVNGGLQGVLPGG
ncbi:MAG: hypothetical protein WBM61_14370 [Woeseiaceae bacterium]